MMDTNIVILITLMIALMSAMLAVLMLYYMRRKKDVQQKNYDFERMRAELQMMREKLEHDIYRLNDRLISTEERWKDVNHLILSSQQKSTEISRSYKKPNLTSFLKSAGIKEDDIEIEKDLIFVLTPFHDEMDNSFEAIRSACNEIGFKCMRGDEEYIEGDVLSHILKLMAKARIVIANISGRNPNVFYELGISHAIDKPTIIVSKSLEGVPFDIQSKRLLLYKNENDLKNKTKDYLAKILASE